MTRRFLIIACVWFTPLFVVAQDEVAALKQRVTKLEAEVSQLRGLVHASSFSDQTRDGVTRELKEGDRVLARLVVARDGWNSNAAGVAAVCESCTKTVLQAIRPAAGREPTILVVRSSEGPMVLSQRGANGEYIVLINSGDRRWAQLAYQFSHELGHVFCGDLSLKKPQHWFEESFCESLSLYTLEKMGESWKTDPPYPNWSSYGASLTSYIADIRKGVTMPDSIPLWFGQHRGLFDADAYDRPKNRILAIRLADQAHSNPMFYQAFYHLRSDTSETINSMEWLLADWQENCPDVLRDAPKYVAQVLGIQPRK